MKYLKIIPAALMLLGSAPTIAVADLSSSELQRLRLSTTVDRNRDGRVSAEEILRARPDAFDTDGNGRLDAVERGIALRTLRNHRFR